MNKYPIEKFLRIINYDCLEAMKYIPDNSIDLVVTSPPYNIGINYIDYNDSMKNDEYYKFIINVFSEVYRLVKQNAIVAIVIGNQRNSGLPHYFYFWIKSIGFKIIKELFWYKGLYYIQGETIFVCSKSGKYNKLYTKKDQFYSNGQFATVWNMRYTDHQSKKILGHPAFFVKQIPINFIKISTNVNDIVLDPFSGSGTTAVAAKMLNRRYIGIDISKEYCNIAEKRLKELDNDRTK